MNCLGRHEDRNSQSNKQVKWTLSYAGILGIKWIAEVHSLSVKFGKTTDVWGMPQIHHHNLLWNEMHGDQSQLLFTCDRDNMSHSLLLNWFQWLNDCQVMLLWPNFTLQTTPHNSWLLWFTISEKDCTTVSSKCTILYPCSPCRNDKWRLHHKSQKSYYFASGRSFRAISVTVSVSPTFVKCGSTEIWSLTGTRLLLIFWWDVIFLYRLNAGDPGNKYFANWGRPCWMPTFLHICSFTFCVPEYRDLKSLFKSS